MPTTEAGRRGTVSCGTMATPKPASTSPTSVETCCTSHTGLGIAGNCASAWSMKTRLRLAWDTRTCSQATSSSQRTVRRAPRAWSMRHASTKGSFSSGVKVTSGSCMPM